MVRGQSDAFLSDKGKRNAQRIAQRLYDKGGLTCLYLSDTLRAKQTANLMKEADPKLDIETPSADIRSWSLGGWEGGPVVEADPKIDALVRHSPSVPPPGRSELTGKLGESFDDFRFRALPYLAKQITETLRNKDLKLGILTHSRVIKLLKAWIAKDMSPFLDVDPTVFRYADPGKPGEIFFLEPVGKADGPWKMSKVDMGSRDRLKAGVYVLRHCETRLNEPGAST